MRSMRFGRILPADKVVAIPTQRALEDPPCLPRGPTITTYLLERMRLHRPVPAIEPPHLKTRRSVNLGDLIDPGPSAAEIETILTIATRVPDHGKLAPWRFIVFEGDARLQAGEKIASAFRADHPQAKPEFIDVERTRLAHAPLVIAVVSRAGPHVKIPEWEQVLSAGAVAMNLVRLCGEMDHRMVCL